MSDTLSLTLPRLGARTRRRFRKPRKPSFWEIYDLFWCGVSVLLAVQDWLQDHPVHAVLNGCVAAWWLYVWQYDRRGQRAPLNATVGVVAIFVLIFVVPSHA